MLRFLTVACLAAFAGAWSPATAAVMSTRGRADTCVMMAKKSATKLKTVTVILDADVEGLGAKGSLVDVKPAYAENFIISKGMGSKASKELIEQIAEQAKAAADKAAAAKKKAEEGRALIQEKFGKGLQIDVQVADGVPKEAVTSADVAADLSRAGVKVDAADVMMADQTELGSVVAEVVLHPDVSASVKVIVAKSKITFS